MKTPYLALLVLFMTATHALDFTRAENKDRGNYIFNLKNNKGIVLCLHGSGGSAEAWAKLEQKSLYLENLNKEGFGFICPTSLNRKTKQWNNMNNSRNKDILNIEGILDDLKVSRNTPLFIIGHSNGGGMVSRFSALSSRKEKIKAVHYANSSGIKRVLEHTNYQAPSIFTYTKCDDVVDPSKVEDNYSVLKKKLGKKKTEMHSLDYLYIIRKMDTCHQFIDSTHKVIPFFKKF